MTLASIGFYILSMLTLIAAVVMVTTRNMLHAVLALAVTSLAVAGLMLHLSAEFLAFVLVLVYVGAVVVIAVFAVMLTGQFDKPTLPPSNELKGLAIIVGSTLTTVLLGVVAIQPDLAGQAIHQLSVHQIGRLLLTEYVLPFELVSVLLLAALVGAIVIAQSKEAA